MAFESIGQLLNASRYAGRLASNSVAQYALWLDEATPEQHDRLLRWWQDEIEGTGRVPVLSCEKKPEVLRFGGGTDADLRLGWQEFLIRMIANAFDLPAMLLGAVSDVNRATAGRACRRCLSIRHCARGQAAGGAHYTRRVWQVRGLAGVRVRLQRA